MAEYRHAGGAAGAATDAILTETGYSQERSRNCGRLAVRPKPLRNMSELTLRAYQLEPADGWIKTIGVRVLFELTNTAVLDGRGYELARISGAGIRGSERKDSAGSAQSG